MNVLFDKLGAFFEPLTSPFLALVIAVVVPILLRKKRPAWLVITVISGTVLAFHIAYRLLALNADIAAWLAGLNQPLFPILLILVFPAIFLPRNKWYKLFLILPALGLGLAVYGFIEAYRTVPEGAGFQWFLIRPTFLMFGMVSLLILIQPLVSMKRFRFAVQLAVFIVLMYGGFAFRQNYVDYQEMLSRRRDTRAGVLSIVETTPVLKDTDKLSYVPAAPCRFSADGGYVQGCTMELLQRVMQVNLVKVAKQDVNESSALNMGMSAAVVLVVFGFLMGRWWCGWACPLSFLGNIIDGIRRFFGLGHLKPSKPVKIAYVVSGVSLGGFGLLLAKAYAHINEKGEFAGCKIPLYPFCKICPGQQICPVASSGPAAYAGIPGFEWLGGFFTFAVLGLLALFTVSFAVGRRLWCRFCPIGMFGGVFNRGSMVALKKDATKCNQCGVCTEACPMDIDTVRAEMKKETVSTFDCTLCLKCLEKCPKDGCLSVEYGGHKILESKFDEKN